MVIEAPYKEPLLSKLTTALVCGQRLLSKRTVLGKRDPLGYEHLFDKHRDTTTLSKVDERAHIPFMQCDKSRYAGTLRYPYWGSSPILQHPFAEPCAKNSPDRAGEDPPRQSRSLENEKCLHW
jgi:hypothetical protein